MRILNKPLKFVDGHGAGRFFWVTGYKSKEHKVRVLGEGKWFAPHFGSTHIDVYTVIL